MTKLESIDLDTLITVTGGAQPQRGFVSPCFGIVNTPAGQLTRDQMALGQAQCGLPRPTAREVNKFKLILF